MQDGVIDPRYGASPVESRQAKEIPGSQPRRSPPPTTGGTSASTRGARSRDQRKKSTGQQQPKDSKEYTKKTLQMMQWNAEGVFNKKLTLTGKLHDLKIDIACIQETHLNQNNRFLIRGYQSLRLDREARHKGGVLTLIKKNIAAAEIKIDTTQEAEIIGCKLIWNGTTYTIYNYYCPSDNDLSQLLNSPEDTATFYSRRWMTASTPDLAFCSNRRAGKANRIVQTK